jgi:hypothetical protein
MQLHVARIATVSTAVLLLTASGCGKSSAPGATGVARVLVSAGLSAAGNIAKVTVTVSKGAGSDFTPIVADLTRSGDQWSGRLTGIPAGPGRQFDAVAYDASGAQVDSGSATATIDANAAAVVSITLQQPSSDISNAFPVIDSLSQSRDTVAANGTVQLYVAAHDPDPGDTLSYGWTATCGAFDSGSTTNPTWTAPSVLGSCQITITVADNHGAVTRGMMTVKVVDASQLGDAVVDVSVNTWPVITGMTGSVTLGATMVGVMAVTAGDPDGDALSYAWSTTCTGLLFDTAPPFGMSMVQFTMPGPSRSCAVTVTVSDGRGGNTKGTLTLPPNAATSSPCTGVTCQSGQTCDPADGVCKATNLCANVTCLAATDLCHVAGTCNAVTGICDSQTTKSCPTGQSCDPGTGSCVAANLCANVTCPPAADLCHVAGTCNPSTGTCSGQVARSCPTGQSCDLGTGSCVAANLCANVTCAPAADLCHVAGTCDPSTGTCSAQVAKSCPSGQSCDATTGQCRIPSTAAAPVPKVARDLQVSPAAGLAMDASGYAYLAAAIYSTTPVSFDGHMVASTGDMDVFLAKYDTTGTNVWAVGYGDAGGAPQAATGAAITKDGTLAVIGNFSGNMTIGSALSSAAQIDFLAGVDAATGSGLWARQLNDGSSGLLKSVAANPNDGSTHGNRIAVCGLASQAATDLVAGATYGGQTDIVIAVYTSNGTRLWSRQIGTASNEECDAVAVDDNGDVYAAGKFDGASLTIPGTPALTGPGTSIRKFLWVAKFDGATGAGLASAAFGNPTGQVAPKSLAADAAGKLVIAGNFSAALPMGATTLTSAGGTDAFIAKLDPAAALAPMWAVRLGGTGGDTANGVATTSTGDVVATGLFNKTATGLATLTASGTTAADVFLLDLDGATGAANFSAAYGDPVTQSGDGVAVNRFGGGANQFAAVGTLNGSIPFPAPAGTVTATGNVDVFLLVGPIQ